KDPIDRCSAYLREKNILTQEIEENIEQQIAAEVADAVEYADQLPGLPAEEALTNVFADLGVNTEYA
ncbi:MAG: TPP-dependent pyruvate/acetoin dehydrogenase alpha subunit, partial [Cellvibrionaceae bacterium]